MYEPHELGYSFLANVWIRIAFYHPFEPTLIFTATQWAGGSDNSYVWWWKPNPRQVRWLRNNKSWNWPSVNWVPFLNKEPLLKGSLWGKIKRYILCKMHYYPKHNSPSFPIKKPFYEASENCAYTSGGAQDMLVLFEQTHQKQ